MTEQTVLLDAPRDGAPDLAVSVRRPLTGSRVPASGIHLSIHRDLCAIETAWRSFEKAADGTVFQTYEWLATWQKHIGAPSGVIPVVIAGADSRGEMLFLLPLAIDRLGPARGLTWLGSDLCDYNAPLLAPDFSDRVGSVRFADLWRDILAELARDPALRFDFVHLEKMPEVVGSQVNPFTRLPVAKNPSRAYQTRLGDDWETYYSQKRSSTTRRRDRTKRKKLSEMGELRFVVPENDEEIADTFDTLVRQKVHALAQMGAANIFARPGWTDFFCALTSDPATRHLVHISRLDVGSTRAAVNFGLLHRGRYYHVLASYDDGEVSRYGPGVAHLQDLMRYAIEHDCNMFDFTIGDERYKRDWCEIELVLYDYSESMSWRGAAAAYALSAFRSAKRYIKQTPVLWKAFCVARSLTRPLRRS